ncbi:MAG TPA: SCO family protein [Chthoniobacterales bacterium]|nr:SCO family protein [Chthoniobacterales bacterium]
MNATTTPRPERPKRAKSFRSIAWYATLIAIPILTALFLFYVRHLQKLQLAQRSLGQYGTVPEFRLTNQDGQPFGSAELKGKVWISAFIFTNCPGPCPIISSRMAEMQKPLEKTDVHLVSFSVDPENDTPEVLRDYAARLRADTQRWTFLTGPTGTIYDLTRSGFKLAVQGASDENPQPIHATRAVLVDRRGAIRGYYDMLAADAVTKLLADTSNLLRAQPK